MVTFPKPSSKLLARARCARRALALSKVVKRAVMERDKKTCRVCGKRADSVHEMRFRSLGGTVSLGNSFAVCGTGTTRCHGKLQRNALIPVGSLNGLLRFLDNARGSRKMLVARRG